MQPVDAGLALDAISGIDREIAALCLAIERGNPKKIPMWIEKLKAKRAMREHLCARSATVNQLTQQRTKSHKDSPLVITDP